MEARYNYRTSGTDNPAAVGDRKKSERGGKSERMATRAAKNIFVVSQLE